MLAGVFFDQLLKITSLPKDCLFLVPGNHDVDRSSLSELSSGAISFLDNSTKVNNLLGNDRDRNLVMTRFQNYQDFIIKYMGNNGILFDSENYFFVKQFEQKGIAILGLNSAWLSSSKEDRCHLILGERQVRTALKKSEDINFRIAVMHHPFDWLNDFDRKAIEILLCDGCNFILQGTCTVPEFFKPSAQIRMLRLLRQVPAIIPEISPIPIILFN